MQPQNHEFLGRRKLIYQGTIVALGLAVGSSPLLWPAKAIAAAEATLPPTPDRALQALMDGNRRFLQHQPQYPDQSQKRLTEVAQVQHPFATVLSCADSRVPPELLFDQGIGSIFDVRIAGNIATPEAIGSVEYAVALLGTPLLMVLGHERCGAVTAAVKNEPLPGNISTFVEAILPAVNQVKDQPGDAVDNAVVANVKYQIERLQRSSLLKERLQANTLKIVGARYDLDTGKVTIVA